jgi:hypothetical protein
LRWGTTIKNAGGYERNGKKVGDFKLMVVRKEGNDGGFPYGSNVTVAVDRSMT